MKRTLFCALGFLLILSGCIELEEKISIRKDGSGYYESKHILSKELTSMLQKGLKGGTTKSDLPISQKELERNFQGKGVKIVSSSFDVVEGRLVSEYRLEFKNAMAFFNVPGMRKRYRFYREGDRLILRSIPKSGMKPGGQQLPSSSFESARPAEMEKLSEEMEGMKEALQESMKSFLKGFKVAITVELPNKILDSNATRVNGPVASWIIDESTFGDFEKMMSMGDHMWASCSLKGLSFRPHRKKAISPALASRKTKEAYPSPRPQATLAPLPKEKPKPILQSPDTLESGGASLVFLKNGNSFEVEGFHKEGDMLTFRKYGGTFSLSISSIRAIQNFEIR